MTLRFQRSGATSVFVVSLIEANILRVLIENLSRTPSRERALRRYDALAGQYDGTVSRIAVIRRDAIESLKLRSGERVLDVACGTGETLLDLGDKVGPMGTVIGVEQSQAMAALATQRVRPRFSEEQIRLVVGPIEKLDIDLRFDAVLMSFTHDVLMNPAAMQRIAQHVKPGARIAIAGLRFLPWWWAAPLNLFNGYRARHYLTSFRGLRMPWKGALGMAPNLSVRQSYLFGSCYRAQGTITQP